MLRPTVTETTALGAAYLAGLQAGVFPSLDHISKEWECEKRFPPAMASDEREKLYSGWQQAVKQVLAR